MVARSTPARGGRTLSYDRLRRVYDLIGRRLDSQAFYEQPAHETLIRHGDFARARHVFELGCGTGRLAARLLTDLLPAEAHYTGVDLSPKMVQITRQRLAPFGDRVQVLVSDGTPPDVARFGSCDRFIATFVLDLLPTAQIGPMLEAARAMLEPGGRLCVTNLTAGTRWSGRALVAAWRGLNRLAPALTGGCRPVQLEPLLREHAWVILCHDDVQSFAVPTEVTVAACGSA